jgi:hypothetical protein
MLASLATSTVSSSAALVALEGRARAAAPDGRDLRESGCPRTRDVPAMASSDASPSLIGVLGVGVFATQSPSLLAGLGRDTRVTDFLRTAGEGVAAGGGAADVGCLDVDGSPSLPVGSATRVTEVRRTTERPADDSPPPAPPSVLPPALGGITRVIDGRRVTERSGVGSPSLLSGSVTRVTEVRRTPVRSGVGVASSPASAGSVDDELAGVGGDASKELPSSALRLGRRVVTRVTDDLLLMTAGGAELVSAKSRIVGLN